MNGTKTYLDRLERVQDTLDEKGRKTYKIETLKKIITEAEKFKDCDTCVTILSHFNDHLDLLEEAIEHEDRKKEYLNKVNEIRKHFHKEHGFIPEGQYLSICIALGFCIGAGIASVLQNYAFIGLGLPLGAGAGIALDEDAKKKGKVI